MIRNTIIYLPIWMLFLFTSCSKDFLERAPSDFIGKEEVFSSLANAEAFLTNAYRDVPSIYIESPGNTLFNLGAGTDEGVSMLYEAVLGTTKFNYNDWNPSAFPMQSRWAQYYRSIRRINMFIENNHLIPNEAQEGSTTVRIKERLLGEAYALRALFYFQLFKMWGEVPIITHVIDPGGEETFYPREPIGNVIDLIKEDLAKAVAILPARLDAANNGRMNATFCHALLSRVLLYYASPLFNPNNDVARWQAALQATETAMQFAENNNFTLSRGESNGLQAYERIFLQLDNPEVIMHSVDFSFEDNFWGWEHYTHSLGYGGWHVEAPIQEFVDAYETDKGVSPVLGYDANNKQLVNPESDYNPQEPYAHRDPRFYQTILYHGAQWKGRAVDIRRGGRDFNEDRPRILYYWRKYCTESYNLTTNSGFVPKKFVLFRLGELYLNYAEALNESLSAPDNRVYDAVNEIRSRSDMPGLPTGLDKNQMRERIRHERRIEFAVENQRFWDVRRWKIAEITDNGPVRKVEVSANGEFTYPIYHQRRFDPARNYLFPIPQLEIDKTDGVLSQNPGWN
ncbi:RagB/SusD family nutrient uptake outer membrane protein [Sphingobacterium composti Ten et al. 2007 non Yoo et al. 2007]|uniref:RagB/SusD family nutrient uptake outer membrane protein n=1 Tax=Sphingobacterium composti TaxID=363260 RepID=UPI001357E56E|nr:RagB/SusD family nutrient uptake outer membrane protein [Sphingobacterium composti Ten et al. 2007 non Yoo et al. 2007]